ncbi:MAG: low molecular weight phosphatase family protein [Caulobacteraceae bacterium]
MARLPGAVLFACNLNRVRSPMAEGLMKRRSGDRIFVESCGLRGGDDDQVDPFAAAVMDEIGVDLAAHRPRTFEDVEADSFDVVISLTPQAHHRAGELARGRSVEIEFWPTLDPTLAMGARDTVLEAYRAVRDSLEAKIARRFPGAGTFGG